MKKKTLEFPIGVRLFEIFIENYLVEVLLEVPKDQSENKLENLF